MEPSLSGKFPYTNYYKDIQKAQYTVLKNIKPLLTLDARHDVILGQYEGYLDEP